MGAHGSDAEAFLDLVDYHLEACAPGWIRENKPVRRHRECPRAARALGAGLACLKLLASLWPDRERNLANAPHLEKWHAEEFLGGTSTGECIWGMSGEQASLQSVENLLHVCCSKFQTVSYFSATGEFHTIQDWPRPS